MAMSSRKMSVAVSDNRGSATETPVPAVIKRISSAVRRIIVRDYSESSRENTYVG
jgi:hypothetical protein